MHTLDFSLLRKRLASLVPSNKQQDSKPIKRSESPFSGWNDALHLSFQDADDVDATTFSSLYSDSSSSDDDYEQYLSEDDQADDFYDQPVEPSEGLMAARARGRRNAICAPSYLDAPLLDPSSDDMDDDLRRMLTQNALFGHLDEDQFNLVMDAFQPQFTEVGQVLTSLNDDADCFSIVQKGVFLLTKKDKSTVCLTSGDSFGHIALMYPTFSDVTVQSLAQGVVWTLDRMTYQRIVTSTTMQKRTEVAKWLSTHAAFSGLFLEELGLVVDELVCLDLDDGETIVERGHPCDYVFILQQGECTVTLPDHSILLTPGHYFSDEMYDYAATVVANGPVKVATLSKQFMLHFFGEVEEQQ